MKRGAVFVLIAVNVIASIALVTFVFVTPPNEMLFVACVLWNALCLLVLLAGLRRSSLSEPQKNAWTIAIFLGLGFAQLLFLLRGHWRHVYYGHLNK